RGQSTPLMASSPGTGYKGSAPTVSIACPYCQKWHKGECWRMIGACLQCGSTDHLVRDCPRRTATSTPVSTNRPAPPAPRGRKPSKAEAADTSQKLVLEFVKRAEGRKPARAYAIRAQEEQDAPNVIK
ncbi:hypothetical protein P3X46_002553, partial [Hevea brasiliensis]